MIKPEIIYEDQYLMAVNKPSGILSIPDRFNPEKPNLLNQLKSHTTDIFVIHRLDRETSGIILFAKDPETHKKLNEAFRNRTIQKKYLAFVNGTVQDESGMIETGLMPDPANPGRMKVNRSGKKSITEYHVLERFKSCTLIEAIIHTGRMHQIRVHCKYIGHPCFVDKLYGSRESVSIREIKQRNLVVSLKDDYEPTLVSRTTLHASKLSFLHPITEEKMDIEAPLPKDLKALLNQLRKWQSQK